MKINAELREAIGDAYRSVSDLKILTRDVLDERLENIAAPNQRLPVVIEELLDWCDAQGRLVEFVLGAHERNKGNPQLQQVTAPLRAAMSVDGRGDFSLADWRNLEESPGSVERVLLAKVGFEDVAPWVQRLTRLFRVVCRIEPQPPSEGTHGYGSGFLVSPDVVMTNYHVVQNFLQKGADRVRLRFDYAVDVGRVATNEGKPVALATDWKIVLSPINELDFALVRLAAPVGDDSGHGAPRGHIRLTPYQFTRMEPLLILQHPAARPLQLSIGSVDTPDDPNHRVSYSANTEPGSSGSPCLTSKLDGVAIHHFGATTRNRGVRFDAIRSFLEKEAQQNKLRAAGLAGLIA